MRLLSGKRLIAFVAAAGALPWLACSSTDNKPSSQERVPVATAPTAVSAAGDRFAEAQWLAEGVADTTIRARAGSLLTETARIRNAVPISWSPVDPNVILMRQACADDDERLVIVNLAGRTEQDLCSLPTGEAPILGSRYAHFVKWESDDTITYEDDTADNRRELFQVVAASSRRPLLIDTARAAVGTAVFEIQTATPLVSVHGNGFISIFRVDGRRRDLVWALQNPLVDEAYADLWTAEPAGPSHTLVPREALQDIFGTDACLLVVRGNTGGAACCSIVSVVGLLADGTVVPLIENWDLNRCSLALFVGTHENSTPWLGLVACDYGLFEGLFGLGFGAGPPRPRILFEIKPTNGEDRWQVSFCPGLQRQYYDQSADMWPSNRDTLIAEIRDFTSWDEGWVPSGLVHTVADLVYAGRCQDVEAVLDLWPADKPGKADFQREFVEVIRASEWYEDIRALNATSCRWLADGE